ncbi:MAG: Phage virion morphosis family [Candidatus Eremiobacteraeota bacterium]|nr:Phage virion morphosis family [Candidatus Eremiobacteraeota bacterium]
MSEIGGMDSLRARLSAMKAATQDMRPALLRAGIVVLKAAADRIDAGGPGWPPNKTHTPLLHRTGRLLASLTLGGSGNVQQIDGDTIMVGTNVQYARWLQDGTNGSIRARKQQRIASSMGAAGFLVHTRAERSGGLPARPYLFMDEQIADRITHIFAKYIMGAGAPGA